MRLKNSLLLVLPLLFTLTACSKKDPTPDEMMKTFINDFSTENIDGATKSLGPALQARFAEKPESTKAAFKARKEKVEKCGGYRAITSKYEITPEQVSVEGYTLMEFNGQCPAEKQFLRLKRSDRQWLIDEFGPMVKQ